MMPGVMVDSNVLLDVLTDDADWFVWSSSVLQKQAEAHIPVINPIVYAEVSVGFDRIEDLDAALPEDMVQRRPIPPEAAFLAGKCFVQYRRRGGRKRSPLPDFFIGAHAAVVKKPVAVCVGKVCEEGDFSQLGIGTQNATGFRVKHLGYQSV